jgi:hypothetical protein
MVKFKQPSRRRRQNDGYGTSSSEAGSSSIIVELLMFKTAILNTKLSDAHAVGGASRCVISVHYDVQAVGAASMRAISACC